jgi:glycosyltransferase involved in cell wall biosynthesis
MKVVVLGTRGFPGVQGGIESHCEKLYRRLAERGCAVTVFMRKAYVTPQSYTFPGIEAVPVDCPKSKYFETIVHTYKCVWAARRLRPDIVHIHGIGPSVLSPLVRVLGMKVVVTNHGPDYERKKWNLPAKLFLKFCEWTGTVFSNAVITIARNLAENLKRSFGRDAAVIPNGVDIPLTAGTEEALKRFGLTAKKYFLVVGRLVPEKGFDSLVDAFAKAGLPDWKLVIVGGADFEDPYSRGFKEKAAKTPNAVLTGFLTGAPLHEIYSHAGLFVLPSFYEGLPIVLLEAMSYGLSCLASDIPANRNIEMDEERFFKPGDVQALSQKLVRYAASPMTGEERTRQVRMIAAKYNWEDIAEQTLEVYRRVLGSRG